MLNVFEFIRVEGCAMFMKHLKRERKLYNFGNPCYKTNAVGTALSNEARNVKVWETLT
jgi:hypothetical protein